MAFLFFQFRVSSYVRGMLERFWRANMKIPQQRNLKTLRQESLLAIRHIQNFIKNKLYSIHFFKRFGLRRLANVQCLQSAKGTHKSTKKNKIRLLSIINNVLRRTQSSSSLGGLITQSGWSHLPE